MTGPANNRGNKPTLMSVILMPIILSAVILGILIYNLVSTIIVLSNGGEVTYDEEVLNGYVEQYAAGFKDSSYLKNTVVVLTVYDEDTEKLSFFVRGGSNVNSEAVNMFAAFEGKVTGTPDYKNAFTTGLIIAMEHMSAEYVKLDLRDSFIKNFDETKMPSPAVVVKEGFPYAIKADEIGMELLAFEAETEVPVVIIADTAANIFGRSTPVMDIIILVLLAAVLALSIASLVKKIRTFKRLENDFGTQEPSHIRVNARSPYYDEDDDEDAPVGNEANGESDEDEEDSEAQTDEKAQNEEE